MTDQGVEEDEWLPGEADVVINGVVLSPAQSMTLRVALNSFLMQMEDNNALGKDRLGRSIAANYRERGREIFLAFVSRQEAT